MPVNHLLVIPMPQGAADGKLRLSVFLSPRLRVSGVLTDYPLWSDWTHLCDTVPIQFTVRMRYPDTPTPTIVTPSFTRLPGPLGGLRPLAWRAIFGSPLIPATVPVQPATFVDRSLIGLTGFPSNKVASSADALTRSLVASGGLDASDVLAAIPDLPELGEKLDEVLAPIGNEEENAAVSEEDFHAILRLLSAHPALMRALGLVYDLEVDLARPGPLTLRVETNVMSGAGLPETWEVPFRVDVDEFGFGVAEVPDMFVNDWLALSDTNSYDTRQLAGGDAADQLARLAVEVSTGDPFIPVTVPSMDDGGMGTSSLDMVRLMRDRLERQADIEEQIDLYILEEETSNPTPRLRLEDYTIGYRIDVRATAPVNTGFVSLNRRRALDGYVLPRNPLLDLDPGEDEGWVSYAFFTDGTREVEALPSDVIYGEFAAKRARRDLTSYRVDDLLYTWSGWGLSVPKPANSTTGDGAVEPQDVSEPIDEIAAKMEVAYRFIPGTLLPLRFGWTYEFRARTVDLGGGGPAWTDTAPAGAVSPQVTYGRVSPVSAPTVLRRSSAPIPGVGEMIDTLVIRSEVDQADFSVDGSDRMLFPPQVHQSLVERHGLPAGAPGEIGGAAPSAYLDLAARDAVDLTDQVLAQPGTGEPVAGAAIVDGDTITPGPLRQPIAYLADPLAEGVAFQGLPDQGTSVVGVPYGTWPTLESVLFTLRAGDSAPTVNEADRSVTAFLPKGTSAVCTVSHRPSAALLDHMRALNLISPTERTALEASILAGWNPAISGTQEITLVHAVRVPLAFPTFTPSLTGARTEIGQTTVPLTGSITLHRATTERVALRADWTDPVDDTDQPGPSTVTGSVFVGDVVVPTLGPASSLELTDLEPDLRDPRRRTIVVSAEAFCRFSRYFTEQKQILGIAGRTTELSASGVAKSSVSVSTAGGTQYVEGTDYTVDARAGTITLQRAGLVSVQYVPLPVSRRSLDNPGIGKSKVIAVPASTPPIAPVVHSYFPASRRSTTSTRSTITVEHDGRVVRVYLERPWYSTGEGEELGVAFDPASDEFTRWARDPLSIGAGPRTRPTLTSFPLRTSEGVDVDGRFDVAGHQVVFDPQQKLWASDVLVNARFGYRPWVQLHMARFQPLAVDGAHLSDVVSIQPIRLGVQRTVTVTRLKGGNVRVKVTGRDNGNQMKAILQSADRSISDPLLRWTDVSTTDLSRTGTRAASVHSGRLSTTAEGRRRLIIEDYEPVKIDAGSKRKNSLLLAYREVIDLPATW